MKINGTMVRVMTLICLVPAAKLIDAMFPLELGGDPGPDLGAVIFTTYVIYLIARLIPTFSNPTSRFINQKSSLRK